MSFSMTYEQFDYGMKLPVHVLREIPSKPHTKSRKYTQIEFIFEGRRVRVRLHKFMIATKLNISWDFAKTKHMDIHHVDGNRLNNHIVNLVLIGVNDHRKIHQLLDEGKKFLPSLYIAKWKLINELIRMHQNFSMFRVGVFGE